MCNFLQFPRQLITLLLKFHPLPFQLLASLNAREIGFGVRGFAIGRAAHIAHSCGYDEKRRADSKPDPVHAAIRSRQSVANCSALNGVSLIRAHLVKAALRRPW